MRANITWTLTMVLWLCVACVDESSIDRETLPVITIEDGAASEGENIILFVKLSKPASVPVDFAWTLTDGGTAEEGVDYNITNGTATIDAGETSTSIEFPTIEDPADETDETIFVRISDITNAAIGADLAIATIRDEDTPEISVNDSSGPEGSNITFTATLNRTSLKTVTFEWTTSDINAVAGSDYIPITAVPASIPAGSLTTTISVTAIADSFDDLDNGETFNMNIGNIVNATAVDDIGEGTIGDSDAPLISVNDIVVTENNIAQFSVSTNIASEQAISVNWATADGTATSPADYIGDTGTAIIPAGALSTTVDVATFNNSAFEASEAFVINLAVPVNATILDNQGTATLNDDDPPPNLSIDDLTFVEGSIFSFTVTKTGATEVNTTFDWATSNGTAVAPGDYTAGAAAGVTLLPGVNTATINVTSLEDVIDEDNQDFVVTLSNPTNAAIADATGVGTITDNDPSPNLSINDQTIAEGTMGTFTATIDAVSERTVTFDITTTDNTAVAPGDYTTNAASLTINAGSTTETFNVNVIDDAVPCEVGENFTVDISNVVAANVADGQGVGTITDNDPTLSVNDIVVSENAGTASFTVTPSVICPGQNIDFDWTTTNGTALNPGDYSTTATTSTILAGNPNVNLVVPLTNDGLPEVAEAFTVNLSNPINAVILDGIGQATINDDDTPPNISIDDPTNSEGNNVTFTISLNTIADSDITVDYTTVDVTAGAPGDYTLTAGTATILAGNLSTTVDVPAIDDPTDETNETFNMVISNANLGAIADNTGVGTINDNDAAPTLSIDDVNIAEGGNIVFTVTMSNDSVNTVTFDWTTVDGTGVAPGDYTANSGVAEAIIPGSTTTTLTIVTIDNAQDGNNKNFTVVLSNPNNATIVDNTGIATINDNDPLPQLSINNVAATEGGGLTFTVGLNATSELPVTFDWSTADGSALQPGDYTSAGAAGETIAAGNPSTTLNVSSAGDAAFEGDETFTITISNPGNATITTATGTGTITDNDPAPTFSINDVAIAEGGNLTFTVSLSFTAEIALSVDYASSDGTALAPGDYTAVTNTLVIPATNISNTFNVATVDDNITENGESVTLTLSNPSFGALADPTGIGTINDNDAILLNSTLAGGQDVQSVAVLPDSSAAIYIADETTDGTNELYAVNLNGTGGVKLNGALPAGGNVTNFALSNNSSKVVFIADGVSDEQFEVYSVDPDGSNLTNLTGGLVAGGDVIDIAITGDSATVVFRADKTADERFEIYSVAIGGGAVTTLNTAPTAGGDITSFKISPDSSKVVFLGDRITDEVFQLFSVNPNGTGEATISGALVAGGDVTDFDISADSTKVVYIADQDVDEDFEVYSVDIGGGSLAQVNGALVANGDVQSFAISDNSAKVVYLADEDLDEEVEIYSANMNGTGAAQLNGALPAGGDILSFAISADSTQVVYLGDENTDGTNELSSVAIGGGATTQLNGALGPGENVTSYAISLDSSKVVYLSDENTTNEFEAHSVNLNGTANTTLNGALAAGGDVSDFAISANSATVLYRADQDTNNQLELYSVAIGGGANSKVSSDFIANGDATANYVIAPNSTEAVYIGDTFLDEVFELLSTNL